MVLGCRPSALQGTESDTVDGAGIGLNNSPPDGRLVCPVVHDFHLDTAAAKVACQHQAGGTSTNDADLSFQGRLGHAPKQSHAVDTFGGLDRYLA